jgi:subtilisin family serine protease
MTRIRCSWSVVPALVALLLIASATLSFAARQFGDFDSDAWYFDKYLQREFTFTPLGDEVLVRFSAQSAASAAPALAQRFGLETVHPVQQYYHHAHYRLAPGADLGATTREISAEAGVISVYPVLVDNDGYTKYVVGHELTVQFAEGLDDADCRNLITLLGSEVAQDHWTPGYYTITVPPKMTLFEAIRAFNDLEEVRFAEFSSVGYDDYAMVPNDTDYPNQQNLNNTGQVGSCVCPPYADHDIRAEAAWDITTGSAGVVIAVIDSGADLDHPDLAANILFRGSEDWDFADPGDSVPEDTAGHGTSCAGIVAAVTNNGQGVAGIAHDCQIMPLRIDLASGMNQNRADAINYAASRVGDFDGLVLSNSWLMSSGSYTAVYNAITAAKTAGCVVCFASGNSNASAVAVPSDSASCICVGAASPCDERKSLTSCDGENFWGSQYGPELDVCAPGVLIHTTALGGGYTTTFNGTSSATPHVAAVAALVLSVNPALTPGEVESILESSARDMGTVGFDNETGWGRIDAEAAVLLALAGTVTGPGYCDDFDRPNDTVVDGWTEQSGNWSISSNRLLGPGTGVNTYITYDGSDQANGCIRAEVQYGSGAGLRLAGLSARYDSDTDRVMAKLQDNTSAGDFNYYYIYDGGSIVASGAGSYGTNPIIELDYTGSVVLFRIDTNKDGIWDWAYNATVSTIDAGLCGVNSYGDVSFNDFCYGPDCGLWTEGTLCESFDDLDGTTVDDWTEQSGDWSIASDRLAAEPVASLQYITRDGSYQADGCVNGRAVYGSGSGVRYMGLVGRFSDDNTKIMAKLQDNSGAGYFDSYFIYDNSSNIHFATGLNFGTEAMIELEYSGTAVVFRVDTNLDGVWDYTYSTTVSNTGYGLTGASAYQQCYLDDWCFGPDCDSWGGDMMVDFDGIPSTYWENEGGVNLGTWYPGLKFGPTATILEATVYGYSSTAYPYHSFDAVLYAGGGAEIRVDINPPTDHVGLWYTNGSSDLVLEGYDSAGTMLASSVGPANVYSNDYLQVNAHGIDHVIVRGIAGYYVIDDFEWNVGTATLAASYDCTPSSGVVPFSTNMSVVLNNLYAAQFRRLAGRIDVTLANGNYYPNWRSGFTNVGGGSNYAASWSNTIPALGAVIGNNTFNLFAEDVTPAPYNLPPYPPAGHEDADGCVITAASP